jgi:molecular chaperone GrpE (heat shock protein)
MIVMTEDRGRDSFDASEEPAPAYSLPELGSELDDNAYQDLNEVLGLRQFKSAAGSSDIEFEKLRGEREALAKGEELLKKENEALAAENETLKKDAGELKNQLATARADLYNFRQRTERERAKTLKMLSLERVADFLPVLDNLDRALSVPEDGTARDVLVGVRMVQRQFLSVLEDAGVTCIPTEGHPFDPTLHDAIETEVVADPGQDGIILHELSRGYRSAERVLRAARVRVGHLKTEEKEERDTTRDSEETEAVLPDGYSERENSPAESKSI